MVTPRTTRARRVVQLAVALAALAGCADDSGTTIAMTLTAGVQDPGDGSHYELFAAVNGSAVSLQKFDLHVPPSTEEHTFVRQVVDHHDPANVLGVVDGVDNFARPIGGIRFRVPGDLTGASSIFITREADGDSDPSPTRDVIATCSAGPAGSGTLGCVLTAPLNKELVIGTVTFILPDDGINPL